MPGHELVEDLALELLDQLVEPLARGRLHEVVVLQAADPLADVGRQRIELVEPPGGRIAQHLAQVVGHGLAGRVATPGRAGARRRARSSVDDLLELLADVAEHVVELVALEHRLALPLQPLHQVAQAGHVAAGRVARPPAAVHQAAERLGEVALGHHVVGERVDDLVRVEVGDLLRPVPGRVAGGPGEGIRRLARRRPAAAGRPARGRAGRASTRSSPRSGHRW